MAIFYSTEINNNYIYLRHDEHNHCTKVLRNQKGQIIKVADGKGKLYNCSIETINKTETICLIDSTYETLKPTNQSAIAISILKNPARLEWFVEKAIEIGITELIIFVAARTEKKSINKERLEKIIVSAMKQSLNLYMPTFCVVDSFPDLLVKCERYQGKYIAWCENEPDLLTKVRNIKNNNIVLIGPEGDFTQEESALAVKNGFRIVSLGQARLRTETAGIVALTLLKY